MSNAAARAGATPIVLAYSGGLDTSFLVPWIAEHEGRPVITVTVDTGGIDVAAARALAERARALDPWRDALTASGRDPAKYRVGIIRPCLVTDDPDRDWPIVRAGERRRMEIYSRFREESGGHGGVAARDDRRLLRARTEREGKDRAKTQQRNAKPSCCPMPGPEVGEIAHWPHSPLEQGDVRV